QGCETHAAHTRHNPPPCSDRKAHPPPLIIGRRITRGTTRRRRRHATATDVKVARPPRPPLSGLMSSRRCVTSTAQTDQSSRPKLVLGGLKLNSCRSSSR